MKQILISSIIGLLAGTLGCIALSQCFRRLGGVRRMGTTVFGAFVFLSVVFALIVGGVTLPRRVLQALDMYSDATSFGVTGTYALMLLFTIVALVIEDDHSRR